MSSREYENPLELVNIRVASIIKLDILVRKKIVFID
jgi:hypothetical protein